MIDNWTLEDADYNFLVKLTEQEENLTVRTEKEFRDASFWSIVKDSQWNIIHCLFWFQHDLSDILNNNAFKNIKGYDLEVATMKLKNTIEIWTWRTDPKFSKKWLYIKSVLNSIKEIQRNSYLAYRVIKETKIKKFIGKEWWHNVTDIVLQNLEKKWFENINKAIHIDPNFERNKLVWDITWWYNTYTNNALHQFFLLMEGEEENL